MKIETTCKPWLGCIADDSTGASYRASFLVEGGFRTIQINGLPTEEQVKNITNVDAVVIALKSRTIDPTDAINISLKSLHCLKTLGCEKFYFKYCSTFDSTVTGNIGPVIDALLAELGQNSTIICPALPVNGRTVYRGHMFVFDQLLSDSPMKDHPLTPMKDSSLVNLIEAQAKGKAGLITVDTLENGSQSFLETANKMKKTCNYIVVDAINDKHLHIIGANTNEFPLITGGSGLAIALGAEFEMKGGRLHDSQDIIQSIDAPSLLLSGSCSKMTQKQVKHYCASHPNLRINVKQLINKKQSVDSICTWLESVKDKAPLIFATDTPEEVLCNQQQFGTNHVAELIEQTFAQVAIAAKEKLGFRNFIVAGGETSGAVVSALQIDSFYIGQSISPGIPMLQTSNQMPINLALKSGNFGQEDFFKHAVETLSCC